MRSFVAVSVFAAVLMVAGCTTSTTGPTSMPYEVVVLGDSLSVDPPHDCDGCTTYMASLSSELNTKFATGVHVKIDAVQDTGTTDTQRALDKYADDLAVADLVLVWIGTNDGPPWPSTTACGEVDTSEVDSLLAGIEGYTDQCIHETIAGYGDQYATLFADIAAASPGAQHLALTTYDNWFSHPFLADSTFEQGRIDAIVEKVATTFDDWNVAQCAAAEAADFECVDTYHLVNGPDGRQPGGILFASDGTHLSQKGHDAVAKLLATIDD
ncbi:hypothetical protein BH09ACT4_BH09ACT4_06530 [soil metagenome]